MDATLKAVDAGGVVLQIGVCGKEHVAIPFGAVMDREVDFFFAIALSLELTGSRAD